MQRSSTPIRKVYTATRLSVPTSTHDVLYETAFSVDPARRSGPMLNAPMLEFLVEKLEFKKLARKSQRLVALLERGLEGFGACISQVQARVRHFGLFLQSVEGARGLNIPLATRRLAQQRRQLLKAIGLLSWSI
jgi:hypothetical protein